MSEKLQIFFKSLHPICILLLSFLTSLLIATNLRCHEALSYFLESEFTKLATHTEFRWLGFTSLMITHLMVPVCAGLVDIFNRRYRICILISGILQLLGCALSAGIQDPGYLIITDTVIAGLGASLMLATVILIIDDYFDSSSPLRIVATTFVQGSTIGTFFFVNEYATLLHNIGWRYVYNVVGLSIFFLSLLCAAVFTKRNDATYRRLLAKNDTNVLDEIRAPGEWRKHILGVTQKEFEGSDTAVLWMLERFLACLITDGTFYYLLKASQITRLPLTSTSVRPAGLPHIIVAFLFSVGSSTSYVMGGFLGCLAVGNLLVTYIVGAFVIACSLIGWVSVAHENFNLELVFACLCGLGVGCINTFAFAASEEATGITSRHIFPLIKIMSGLSCITLQMLILVLDQFKDRPIYILLILLIFVALTELCLLIFIRRNVKRQKERVKGKRVLISLTDEEDPVESVELDTSVVNRQKVLES